MDEHASQAGRAGDAEKASDRVSAEGAGATDIKYSGGYISLHI